MTVHKKFSAPWRAVLLGILVAVFSGAPAVARAKAAADGAGQLTKAQVLSLQKKFQDASVAADVATVSSLMADDAIFAHGNGMAQTKAQYLAWLNQVKLLKYESEESKVIFFHGGAIVTGVTDIGIAPPANAPGRQPIMLHMRVSTVWVRTHAGWQLLLNQGTPITAPPGPRPVAGASSR